AQFFPTEQSNAVNYSVVHADSNLEPIVIVPVEFHLPDLLNECHVHRDGEERGRRLATEPERESSITHMSVTTCNFARTQPITVRRAPIHSESLALMYRHRHLGRADTEALDRLRGTTNECNRSKPELVFECDSSARWRGFEIDRERVLAIWRFDRSHGGTCAGKPSKAFCCKPAPYADPRTRTSNPGSLSLRRPACRILSWAPHSVSLVYPRYIQTARTACHIGALPLQMLPDRAAAVIRSRVDRGRSFIAF